MEYRLSKRSNRLRRWTLRLRRWALRLRRWAIPPWQWSTRRQLSFLILLGSWALLGCGDAAPGPGETSPAGPTVSDSAGIRIVVNHEPQWRDDEGWEVDSDASLEIGGVEAPPEAHLVVAGPSRSLSDGRILTGDLRQRWVAIFGSDGGFQSRVGRSGEGPGELQSPSSWLVLGSDSLVFMDLGTGRLSFFGEDGTFLDLVRLEDPAGVPGLQLLGRAEDGRLAGRAARPGVSEPGTVGRDELELVMVDPESGGHMSVTTVPGTERFTIQRELGDGRQVRLYQPLPLGREGAVVFHGNRFFSGDGIPFQIRVHTVDGDRGEIWRVDEPPAALGRGRLGELRERINELTGDEGDVGFSAQGALELWDDAPLPSSLPAFGSLHVDALGYLWVGEYELLPQVRPPGRYSIFNPEGTLLGTVHLPEPLRITEVGSDFILGHTVDEMGVPVIRTYGLTR